MGTEIFDGAKINIGINGFADIGSKLNSEKNDTNSGTNARAKTGVNCTANMGNGITAEGIGVKVDISNGTDMLSIVNGGIADNERLDQTAAVLVKSAGHDNAEKSEEDIEDADSSIGNITGKAVNAYRKNDTSNLKRRLTKNELKNMEEAISEHLERIDAEVDDENIEISKALIRNNIPVTKENINMFKTVKKYIQGVNGLKTGIVTAAATGNGISMISTNIASSANSINSTDSAVNSGVSTGIVYKDQKLDIDGLELLLSKLNKNLDVWKEIDANEYKKLMNLISKLENARLNNYSAIGFVLKNNLVVNLQNMGLAIDSLYEDTGSMIDISIKNGIEGYGVFGKSAGDNRTIEDGKSANNTGIVSVASNNLYNGVRDNGNAKSFSSRLSIGADDVRIIREMVRTSLESLGLSENEDMINAGRAVVENGLSLEKDVITKVSDIKKSLDKVIEFSKDVSFKDFVSNFSQKGVKVLSYPLDKLENAIMQYKIGKAVINSGTGYSRYDGQKGNSANDTVDYSKSLSSKAFGRVISGENSRVIYGNVYKVNELSVDKQMSGNNYVSDILNKIQSKLAEFTGMEELAKAKDAKDDKALKNSESYLNQEIQKKYKEIVDTAKKFFSKDGLKDIGEIEEINKLIKQTIEKLNSVSKEVLKELSKEFSNSVLNAGENAKEFMSSFSDKGMQQNRFFEAVGNQYFFQIPIEYKGKFSNLSIQLYNRKNGKKEIDPENMTIALNLETETLGILDIAVKVEGKNAFISIGAENSYFAKYVNEKKLKLIDRINDLGINISNISTKAKDRKVAKEDSKVNALSDDEGLVKSGQTGKNVFKKDETANNSRFEVLI